ncbi:hypothetical protein DXG01_014449 [Tephrocybe rancida]|nr:hypothetical protein DXG01_014449 [Tephrocybe rancida]
MSYSYGPYSEDFSNPTTPLAFPTWETMETEQQDQAQAQAQVQAQSQQQQQQHQQHQQQHFQQQHQQSPEQPSPPPPDTPQQNLPLQLEDPTRVVPSQSHSPFDNTPIVLHPVSQRHEGQRESLRNPRHHSLHVDTRSSSSVASTSANPSAIGPSRQPRSSHRHQQQAHPYRRPPSAMSSAPPSRQQPLVRFSSVQPLIQPSLSRHAPSSGMHSPVVPLTAMPSPAIPSPASATSRLAGFGSVIGSPVDTLLGPPTRDTGTRGDPRRKTWMLRADSWYDPEAKKLRVMLEVPGVRKADVRVTLSTCSWNRVKQITVTGVSRPVFPSVSSGESVDGMMLEFTTMRERQFGEFARTFAVPAETNREDIEVSMEGGILYINIPCGIPVAPDAEEVPIP